MTPRTGFQVIRGCARGLQRSQKSAAAPGGASRKRATLGVPAMEGALGRRRTQRVTARRAETVLVALSRSGGRQTPKPRSRGATEGVRGTTMTFSPGR